LRGVDGGEASLAAAESVAVRDAGDIAGVVSCAGVPEESDFADEAGARGIAECILASALAGAALQACSAHFHFREDSERQLPA
jgi:hypothetical protein